MHRTLITFASGSVCSTIFIKTDREDGGEEPSASSSTGRALSTKKPSELEIALLEEVQLQLLSEHRRRR